LLSLAAFTLQLNSIGLTITQLLKTNYRSHGEALWRLQVVNGSGHTDGFEVVWKTEINFDSSQRTMTEFGAG